MIKHFFYPLLFISASSAYAQNNQTDNYVSEENCQNELQNNLVGPNGALQFLIDNLGKNYDPNNPNQGKTVDAVLVTALTAGLANYTAGVDGLNINSIKDLINQILSGTPYQFPSGEGNLVSPHCKIDPGNVVLASKLIKASIYTTIYATEAFGTESNGVTILPKDVTLKASINSNPETQIFNVINTGESSITIQNISGIKHPLEQIMTKKNSCRNGMVLSSSRNCKIYLKIDTTQIQSKKLAKLNVTFLNNEGNSSSLSNITYGVSSNDCVPFKIYAPAGIGYAIEVKGVDNPNVNLGSCSILNHSNYGGNIEDPNYFKNINVWNETPSIYVLKNSTITLHRYWGSNNDYNYQIDDGKNNYVQCRGTTYIPSKMDCSLSHKKL
jgi:hypothetical protein